MGALLILLAAVGAPELPLPVAAKTEHVVVRTDLGEDWAKRVAGQVEIERLVIVAACRPHLFIRRDHRPLTLLAFRSSAAYRRYAAKHSPPHVRELGWYDHRRAIAVVHTEHVFPVRHEAAHWVLREVLGLPHRKDRPLWIAEGIPCEYEVNHEYRRHRLAAALAEGLDPSIGLTATVADLGRGRDDTLYAAAWITASYLWGHHRPTLRAYLKDGTLPQDTIPGLADAIREYARKIAVNPERLFLEASKACPALVPDPERPASPAEVGRQVEFLRHPDRAIQRSAMKWFEDHEHAAVGPALVAALPGESDRFRWLASRILEKIDVEAVYPVLVDLLESGEGEMRLAAIRSLKRLTGGTDHGFRPRDDETPRAAAVARWRAWLAVRLDGSKKR